MGLSDSSSGCRGIRLPAQSTWLSLHISRQAPAAHLRHLSWALSVNSFLSLIWVSETVYCQSLTSVGMMLNLVIHFDFWGTLIPVTRSILGHKAMSLWFKTRILFPKITLLTNVISGLNFSLTEFQNRTSWGKTVIRHLRVIFYVFEAEC